MMGTSNERMMLLLGQLFMVVLALVLAVAPRLYLVAIIAYFALIFGISFHRSRRAGGARVTREEVERARTLLKEDKSFELALNDEEYVKAMSRQAKAMLVPLLLFPLYIIIFREAAVLQPSVSELLSRHLGISDERVAAFIVWLIVFEALFLLNQAVRLLTAGRGQQLAPMVPAGFRVTDKGIVIKGGLGQVIGFPLPEGTEVRLNEQAGYVEIKLPRSPQSLRLYTRKARRLYDLIVRYGLRGGEARGSGEEKARDQG